MSHSDHIEIASGNPKALSESTTTDSNESRGALASGQTLDQISEVTTTNPESSSMPSTVSFGPQFFESKQMNSANVSTNPGGTSKAVRYNRIFKKTSQDGNLILFLPLREILISEEKVDPLMGVALVHENIAKMDALKVFLQVVLVFRYGREDEELMGLRFSNEIILSAEEIFPTTSRNSEPNQMKTQPNEQGYHAVPFALDMGTQAPPSIRLIPRRQYSGAPIGTSYEVQLYASKLADDLPKRRKMVQMSIRLLERLPPVLPSTATMTIERNFAFTDNNLQIFAKLDHPIYMEADTVNVSLAMKKPGGHKVKKIKITAIQGVSVAMFSTGNFKNNIGYHIEEVEPTDTSFNATIPIKLELTKDYSWVAMDEPSKKDAENKHLAPSVLYANKSMFIIRVSYYVHVALNFGLFHRDISLKLPFMMKRQAQVAEQ